jgi:UDP-N-acetylglucosamine 1-carboxyvinyltransferase
VGRIGLDHSYIQIQGGRKLCGALAVQGAKNTVLPVLAATLLARGKFTLYHCPKIQDVFDMTEAMEHLGCEISWVGHTLWVDTSRAKSGDLPGKDTGNFRASVLLMGALLGRDGYVSMEKPGGCRIGARPINYHLQGFQSLGATVEEEKERYYCKAEKLKGAQIYLPFPSVGATENLLLASVTADGTTVLTGCAREPEICDLCEFLNRMGAEISGAGTDQIRINGRKKLRPVWYYVPADRIAAATYLLGAMVTGGEVELFTGCPPERFLSTTTVLEQMGAFLWMEEGEIFLKMKERIRPIHLATGPHPEPPTDIQSMVLAAVLKASGPSTIEENIFESRYHVAGELCKMGGNIEIHGKYARVQPVEHLLGQEVNVMDLRGGACLVLAGLMAEGTTKIRNLSYLKRGYENITVDFQQLGAEIIQRNQEIGENDEEEKSREG